MAEWLLAQMLYGMASRAWFVAHWVCYFVGTPLIVTRMVLCWWFAVLSAATFAWLAVGC